MSIFEYNDYGYENYQRDHDWRDEQAYEHDMDMIREMQEDERRAEQYAAEQEQEETTGERAVREALEDMNEDVRQLAQISVGGVYRYELDWLPETHEIRAEVAQFPDGSPMYLWYPDTMNTEDVLSKVMSVPGEQLRITDLTFFKKDDKVVVALDYEICEFFTHMWRYHAEDGTAMQFNVEIACPNDCYDAACDGTNCEFKPKAQKRPHGIDGTQCDCSDCTFDHGLCSCGCGGNIQAHNEWLEERKAFVHETVNPPPSPKPMLEIEGEDDNQSETSVESAEEKESRLWSDFKLAMMSALLALILGAYICRSLIC